MAGFVAPRAGGVRVELSAATWRALRRCPWARHVAAASATRAWVAPGLLARASARIVGPLVLEIEGGAAFPLLRYRFYFSPDVTAHVAPTVSLQGSIGVGLQFP